MRQVKRDREAVLRVLRRYKQGFERLYGVTALGLFGSLARGEATPASDVDVVVCMRDMSV